MTTSNQAYTARVALWKLGMAEDATGSGGYGDAYGASVGGIATTRPLAVALDNGDVDALLAHIPATILDPDPQAAPALTLTTTRLVRVEVHTGILTIREADPLAAIPVAPVDIDLRWTNLAGLAAALPPLTGGLVSVALADVPTRNAPVLLDQWTRTSATVTSVILVAWQADTWRLLYPIAAALESARQAIIDAQATLDLRRADGDWLSVWGDYLGVPTLAGESAETYRQRLLYTWMRPRSNNKALEALLLQGLGIHATVVDDISINFQWNHLTWAGNGAATRWMPDPVGKFFVTTPATAGYTLSQVRVLVEAYKAAGTIFDILINDTPWSFLVVTEVATTAGSISAANPFVWAGGSGGTKQFAGNATPTSANRPVWAGHTGSVVP